MFQYCKRHVYTDYAVQDPTLSCHNLSSNLYSGQYLKNGSSDLIQICHVDVTGPGGVLYSFVTLNSH